MTVLRTSIGTSPHVHIAASTAGGVVGSAIVGLLSQWKPWEHLNPSVQNTASLLIIAACTYAVGYLSMKLQIRQPPATAPVDPGNQAAGPPGTVQVQPAGGAATASFDSGKTWVPIRITPQTTGDATTQAPRWPGPTIVGEPGPELEVPPAE